MEINDILTKENLILRVLSIKGNNVLVIDCKCARMPYFASASSLKGFIQIGQEALLNALKSSLKPVVEMTNIELKEVQEKYNIISPVLPFIDDVDDRSELIDVVAKRYNITTQTVRNYLKRYLVYQDKSSLLHQAKVKKRDLSADEKNYRYALNKWFYTSSKRSLKTSYLYMLREKYSDEDGNLLNVYPKFHQFKYFYYKHRNYSNYLISRETRGKFDKDLRPLLGDTKSYFNSIGYGEVDSTIADIWLIDDNTNLVGRPNISVMVCPFSHLCLGYSVSFEAGVELIKQVVLNANSNGFGIPGKIIGDRGKEYLSSTYENLTDLGIEMINLKAFLPNAKGEVEKFFDIVQDYFKEYLMNKGVIRQDVGLRGAPDYRTKATLTIDEFRKVFDACIDYYNTKRVVDVPYKYLDDVRPFAIEIFKKDYEMHKNAFIKIPNERLVQVLLPRTSARFSRNGLVVNGLRYRAYGFINDYLAGSKDEVAAYDPFDVSYVYLIRNGEYIRFELIEKYFESMSLLQVDEILEKKKNLEKSYEEESLQGQVKLGITIDNIANKNVDKVNINNVKEHRQDVVKKERLSRGEK